MGQYKIRPLAWREIYKHLDYLEKQAGAHVADRFITNLLVGFASLAGMAQMGSPCGFKKPALRQVRRWPVKDFENWLIFYRPRRYGVEIIRVIHAPEI